MNILRTKRNNGTFSIHGISTRDKVKVRDSKGKWHRGTVVNINQYREPDMLFAVDIGILREHLVFVGTKNIKKLKSRVKR